MKSTASTPLVHFDDQSLIRDCESAAEAAANVLKVDINAALVYLKPDLLLNLADQMSNPFLGMQLGYQQLLYGC